MQLFSAAARHRPCNVPAVMRRLIGILLVIAGCSGAETRQPPVEAQTRSETPPPLSCVEIGGGELQVGLTLGLGGGDVRVTAVQSHGGSPIGFSVETSASDFFAIISAGNNMCSDGKSFVSAAPITRVDFCTGGTGCL
jgi:hypothetical protein